MPELTPQEIVKALDEHIVGQPAAKKAVANALRNRLRRMQVAEPLRSEITPKNILMIGPTGVGKTEIARRLAKLVNAPFVKVEATKFTEVGYVGRNVDSIIWDLMDVSFKLIREQELKKVESRAAQAAEERILDVLLPRIKTTFAGEPHAPEPQDSKTRELFREKLRKGELDDKEIEIHLTASMNFEVLMPNSLPGMEERTGQLKGFLKNLASGHKKNRKMRVKDAFKAIFEEEAEKLMNDEDLKIQAIHSAEQQGIVFIDELDKITQRSEHHGSGADVSREGVQRDLLPLIEGSTVSTKYGSVRTDHILFIASGAFHLAKPSDLIPELQGRLPVRVELKALESADFERILIEPKGSLTQQYSALLATEKVKLIFDPTGITRLAEIAFQVNERTENIGARRLHTIMERLLEDISYRATELAGKKITINGAYVDKTLKELAKDEDLSRYIL